MKKTESPNRREPHHLNKEPAQPVVIHHTDDRTALAHWFGTAAAKGPRYWLTIALVVAVGVALVTSISAWLSRPKPASEAWLELIVPSTVPVDADSTTGEGMPKPVQALMRVAERHGDTSAGRWALVRAGVLLYEEALLDLPANREVARPRLAQALELFNRVLGSAPAGAPEALVAASCKARALETRGEIDEAIAQYQDIVKKWPKTDQAEQAAKRAELLARPESKKFYEEFYALDFSKVFPPSTGASPGGVPAPTGVTPGQTPAFGTPLVPPLQENADSAKRNDGDSKPLPGDVFAPPATPEKPAEGDAAKKPG